MTEDKICILGAGSWGSTLCWLFSTAGQNVVLWTHTRQKAERLKKSRKIESSVEPTLPVKVEITNDLQKAISKSSIIIFCCNSQSMRPVAQQVAQLVDQANSPILISAAKGLELSSWQRMSEILLELMPNLPVCSLSGPNLAIEIQQRLPAASVIGCSNLSTANLVQQKLTAPSFRLYTTNDIVGVELGGTLKNIIAIAAGCSDGLNLGVNAKSALLTRGLAEITRLAVALGAQSTTLFGLSGMGDLFATCSSTLSRNYRLGFHIAEGKSLQQSLGELNGIAEGVPTAEAVCELSQKLGLDMPIAQQVEATLKGRNTPRGAIMALMSRPLASE